MCLSKSETDSCNIVMPWRWIQKMDFEIRLWPWPLTPWPECCAQYPFLWCFELFQCLTTIYDWNTVRMNTQRDGKTGGAITKYSYIQFVGGNMEIQNKQHSIYLHTSDRALDYSQFNCGCSIAYKSSVFCLRVEKSLTTLYNTAWTTTVLSSKLSIWKFVFYFRQASISTAALDEPSSELYKASSK